MYSRYGRSGFCNFPFKTRMGGNVQELEFGTFCPCFGYLILDSNYPIIVENIEGIQIDAGNVLSLSSYGKVCAHPCTEKEKIWDIDEIDYISLSETEPNPGIIPFDLDEVINQIDSIHLDLKVERGKGAYAGRILLLNKRRHDVGE